VFVEALVAQAAVEAFDKTILHRLAGRDVVHSIPSSSCQANIVFDVNSVPLSLTIMRGHANRPNVVIAVSHGVSP
jgi:hypothetical protein